MGLQVWKSQLARILNISLQKGYTVQENDNVKVSKQIISATPTANTI